MKHFIYFDGENIKTFADIKLLELYKQRLNSFRKYKRIMELNNIDNIAFIG